MEEPKPTPIEKQSTGRQMEESLDKDPPPETLNPKKKWRESAGCESSHGDTYKPPAEGSPWNHAGKVAEWAQIALEDEQFEESITIYNAAAISDDHEYTIDVP